MEGIKLDKKDLRILDELDKNPNLNVNKLAKNVGLSRQVAEYRLNKLISQKTISGVHPLIDVGKLGYTIFSTHIRLRPASRETYMQFAKELFADYPAQYISFISGSFDLIFDMYARSLNDFDNLFSEIAKKYKEIIQSYEVFIVFRVNVYQYRYFLGENNEGSTITIDEHTDNIPLDDIDIKLLHSIKFDSRKSYETIGKEIGLTRNAVKERIKRLEKNGVIAGYSAFIDYHHLDKQAFRIFIRYNNHNRDQEKSLIQYLKQISGVVQTVQLFGKWNLDLEVHTNNVIDLQRFIMELRDKYNIIEDYDITSQIEELAVDTFPDKLNLQRK